MKPLHSLVTGFRPAFSIVARRIAFRLIVFAAGLVVMHPCLGAPFQFEETGSLVTARGSHTATLLPNGEVLVAGGCDLGSAEVSSPASGTWTATGSLATHAISTQRHCCARETANVQGSLAQFEVMASEDIAFADCRTSTGYFVRWATDRVPFSSSGCWAVARAVLRGRSL